MSDSMRQSQLNDAPRSDSASLPRLVFSLPPDTSRLLRARERTRDYLQQYCDDPQVVDDLVLAMQEACTNAIVHSESSEPIEVAVHAAGADMTVEVRDHGEGFDLDTFDPDEVPSLLKDSGRGLYLMAHLADEFELRNDDGLVVRLIKRDSVTGTQAVPTVEGGLAPATHKIDILPRQSRLHVLLEGIDEAFIALDWEYRIVHVNAAAERLLRSTREALIGRELSGVLPLHGSDLQEATREAMELGRPAVIDHLWPVGSVWYEIRIYPTLAGVSLYLRSIDERMRRQADQEGELDESLRQRDDLLEQVRLDEVLLAVSQTVHSTLEVDEIMARTLEAARSALDLDAGTIEKIDDGSWLVLLEDGFAPGDEGERRSDTESPVAARAARARGPISFRDLRDDPETAAFAEQYRIRGCVAVPLFVREQIIGVLSVWNRAPRDFSPVEVNFVQRLADEAALALENAHLYEAEALEAQVGEPPPGIMWRIIYGSRVHPLWVLIGAVFVEAIVLGVVRVVNDTRGEYGLPGSWVALVVLLTGAVAGAMYGVIAAGFGGLLFWLTVADRGGRIGFMTTLLATAIWAAAGLISGYLAGTLRSLDKRRRAAGIALAKAAAVRQAEQVEQRRVEALAAQLGVEREQLREMIEHTGTAIAILDREFRFMYINEAYAEAAQRKSEALVGHKHFDLFPSVGVEAAFVRARDTGEAVIYRARHFSAFDKPYRGSSYWDWRLASVKDARGELRSLVLSMVEVTDRVQSERLGETLNAINARISSRLDARHIESTVLALAAEALGADGGWLMSRVRDGWRIDESWGKPAPEPGTTYAADELPLATLALRDRRPLFSADYRESERANIGFARAFGFTSKVVIPLFSGDGSEACFCYVYVERRESSLNEADFARKVSAAASQALENARFLADVQRVAVTLQENLIHPLGAFYGLELGRVSQTAYQPDLVGGDFSHVFRVGENCLGIVIGDVEGKGIRAAGLTETVRSAVVAFSLVDAKPDYVLEKTNQLLLGGVGKGQFVTACYMLLDLETGSVDYAIAGHPSPVLLRPGSCTALPGRHGLPLGAFEREDEYELDRVTLAYGDCLVLFTDGVTEARSGDQLFGERRIIETLSGSDGLTAQGVAERLRAAASNFAVELRDDLQILAIKYMREATGE